MSQFEELTDSEWALIEGLFCNEVVPPDRSGRGRKYLIFIAIPVSWKGDRFGGDGQTCWQSSEC